MWARSRILLSQLHRQCQVPSRHLCTGEAPSLVRKIAPRQNLYELVAELPNYGVGAKVYRKGWLEEGDLPENHHLVISKTILRQEPRVSKVFGKISQNGKQSRAEPKAVTDADRKDWRWLRPAYLQR